MIDEPDDVHRYAHPTEFGFRAFDLATMTAVVAVGGEHRYEFELRRADNGEWQMRVVVPANLSAEMGDSELRWDDVGDGVGIELEARYQRLVRSRTGVAG